MNCDMVQSEVACPVRAAARLLSGKYKSVILWIPKNGSKRFNKVHILVLKTTRKMITKQLREWRRTG